MAVAAGHPGGPLRRAGGSDAAATTPSHAPIILAHEQPIVLGPLTIKPALRRISHEDGREVSTQPRVMQALVAFMRVDGQILTHDDLIANCWDARVVGDDAINRVLSAIRRLSEGIGADLFRLETITKVGHRLALQNTVSPSDRKTVPASSGWRLQSRTAVTAATVAALIAVTLFWLLQWVAKPSLPVVQVRAAESSRPSQAIARNLFVKLGHIASSKPGLMTLVDDRKGEQTPDLILEIGAANVDQRAYASLALRGGKRQGLLWSKDFEQTDTNQTDLRQQVALTAARVLGCAVQTMNIEGPQLQSATQKIYLNACDQLAEIGPGGPEQVIPALLRVVSDAPEFKPGWAKLLMAEAETARSATGQADAKARSLLRQHISTARQLDSTMPEAKLAEISLLPVGKFNQAEEIADRAKQLDPNNVTVLTVRSKELQAVGRMNEAIEDAQRAAKLDRLSPEAHSSYILALAYGGRIAPARAELRRAERLWQGTDTLRGVQYAFHLRFGDPRQALHLGQSVPEGLRLFLDTRADPSPGKVDRLVAFGNSLPGLAAQRGLGANYLSFIIPAFGEFGRHDDLFRGAMGWPRSIDLSSVSYMLFRPALKSFRHEPRFMQVAKRAGLVDYWHKSGKWPDFCFEPDLPYDCKNEAAKLS